MWKDIINWENLYEINECGEVRSKRRGRLIKGDCNNTGYKRVVLYDGEIKQRFFRHRLVAIHFIENENNLQQVNHKDGDRQNNHVSNLEWVSNVDNEIHKIKHLKKENYKPFKVIYDDNKEETFDIKSQLGERLGLSKSTIKNWLHNKYITIDKYGIKEIKYI